ncbi:MAG: FKBP-type peptidyl-prolyl cis-trans isomerase [Prolixibacteraceae bacterium]|nr:FKBP-type peptidyl-prolyl cis-trans isomerase [Prolixibacteraceae bacterium]
MKLNFKSIILMGSAVLVMAGCSDNSLTTKSVKLTSSTDSASYALGILIGENNKQNLESSPAGKKFNDDLLINGFVSTMKGEKGQITSEESRTIVQAFFKKVSEEESTKNEAEGKTFLEKNKTKEGIVTTKSGLQYKIVTKGTGKTPTADETVECNYKGTLIDGTEFDSSKKNGEPVKFKVGQVIPGWTEALKLMPVGSKWELYIPGELAYGTRGAGKLIGPNSTLIFEVELVSIVPDKK